MGIKKLHYTATIKKATKVTNKTTTMNNLNYKCRNIKLNLYQERNFVVCIH